VHDDIDPAVGGDRGREPADREVSEIAVAAAVAELGRHVFQAIELGVERVDLRELQLAAPDI